MATQYNSLVVDRGHLSERQVWAENELGEVQGIVIRDCGEYTAWGVQFHPESFLSEQKEAFSHAWTNMVASYYKRKSVSDD
jgi:anthranilate/para-aminobenzoate synthase component II